MPIQVSRAQAQFGYGPEGSIFEIADPLPGDYWAHPDHAWSPLISSRIPGLEGVWLKYEGSHLSGSFKDRIMSASVGELLAQQPDCPGVVVPSSGNAAVSAAALCAPRKLPMIAIVPMTVPVERLRPVIARGALVIRAGEGPSQAYALADRLSDALGYFRLYSTFASPWAEWGCRSLGHELAGQLGREITRVVAPVSAGPVLVGLANGLVEAGQALPQLVAVQAEGCAPIARAFRAGQAVVEPWIDAVDTKAAAIADRLAGYPQDGTRVLEIVRASDGSVEAVSDAELSAARAALLRYDGVDAEFSACAGVALLMRDRNADRSGTVCVITASGFKHTFTGDAPEPAPDTLLSAKVMAFLADADPAATFLG
ncbi:pyridoxal-phosphate dependent enzyme [Devosia sediminis]|uniref:Pyridoxal-phosphate dependent enzyme n=1 Tax=Devosia sediminis TaxID=2798801 RepID=A0A934MMS4_9HYPH|nr:pyridoxal-phosphate dependent enzyme [Devosia sediminis]MBJ3786510.1 pyridoxal-phosphate dependent enzyme [Devosia sediminis]